MTGVKGEPLPALMDLLYGRVRRAFDEEDWGGLRTSHLRLLRQVPDEGLTITALAERLRMTKQGCGQFVTFLNEGGYLRVSADADDRRVRNVHRTAKGTRTLRRFNDRLAQQERNWAREVGARRYAEFRRTLEELAGYDAP